MLLLVGKMSEFPPALDKFNPILDKFARGVYDPNFTEFSLDLMVDCET